MITPFFLKMSPFIAVDDFLYQIGGNDHKGDFIILNSEKIPLVKSAAIKELEFYDKSLYADAVFRFKENFIQDRLNVELKKAKDHTTFVGDQKTLNFILTEVFAQFMDGDVDAFLKGEQADVNIQTIDEMLAVKINTNKKDIKNIKKEILNELEQPKVISNEEDNALDALLKKHYGNKPLEKTEFNPDSSLFSGVLKYQNSLILSGKIYDLSKKSKQGNLEIVIDGSSYGLASSQQVSSLVHAYNQRLSHLLKIEALDEFENRLSEIEVIRQRNKVFERFTGKKEYEMNDVGFLKKNSEYFVYLKVPKFAIKHPTREQYFKFEQCKVAVNVYESGNRFVHGGACVIENYTHPFLQGKGPFQKICNLSQQYGKYDDAMRIVKALSDAKNNMMHGMTVGSFQQHGGTDINNSYYWNQVLSDKLRDTEITKKEAERQGYVISNIHLKV